MDPEICLEVVKYRDLPSGAAGRTVLAVFLRTGLSSSGSPEKNVKND
jgi:hypothetical protein